MKLREFTQFIQDTKCTNQLKPIIWLFNVLLQPCYLILKQQTFIGKKNKLKYYHLAISYALIQAIQSCILVSSPYVVTAEVSFHFESKIILPTSNTLILNSSLTRCRNHHENCGEVWLYSSKISKIIAKQIYVYYI